MLALAIVCVFVGIGLVVKPRTVAEMTKYGPRPTSRDVRQKAKVFRVLGLFFVVTGFFEILIRVT